MLDPAMIVLNRLRKAGSPDARQLTHLQVIGRPVFNVTVCDDDLEHTDQAIIETNG